MIKFNFFFKVLALLCISMSAFSEDLICKGKVDNFYISDTSGLYVDPDWGGWKRICSLDSEYNGISTDTCTAWLSAVQIALAADKDLSIKLADASGDCESQADNSGFPKPKYLKVSK